MPLGVFFLFLLIGPASDNVLASKSKCTIKRVAGMIFHFGNLTLLHVGAAENNYSLQARLERVW